MRQIIKEDIMSVIAKVIEALKNNDYSTIAELSNHTIHDASIFQEDDPLTLAVLVYALSKIISRSIEREQTPPAIAENLKKAHEALKEDDDNAYRSIIK